jgi:hypothetical protein
MAVPFVACMALVATLYHLPPRVLPAIQGVEGGRPELVSQNTDGSQDLGIMQVNTRWLEPLARFTGLDTPTVRERLLTRPCFNIAAAGLILRTYLNETHGNLMQAVGDYHSHTRPLNTAYQAQVIRSAWTLFVPRPPLRARLAAIRRVRAG